MSFITRFALNTNRITAVFIILTIVIGVRQFINFPRQEDPPITIREVVVFAFFPGMNPIDIESLVTRKIEAQLRTLPEVKDIWSDSKTGKVIIHADTRDEYDDLDDIWQKIRNKMEDLKPELPEGTIGPFVNDEFGLTAVATIAMTAEGFSMAEMRPVARDIRDRLYDLQGIRKVELWGIQEEQIFLKYSSTTLFQKGISIGEIVDALEQQNIILPGGVVEAEGLDPVFLIAPTSTDERIARIGAVASGFVYYVSLKGVTGAAHIDVDSVRQKVETIRGKIDLPIGVGFGISDAEAAARVSACSDAVVVGSAIVKRMAAHRQHDPDQTESIIRDVSELLGSMREAMDAVPVDEITRTA